MRNSTVMLNETLAGAIDSLNGANETALPCQRMSCVVFITVEALISLVAVMSNCFVIFAFWKFKWLRSNTNIAIVSLALVDVLTGLISMPYNIVIGYLVKILPALHHLAHNKYFCIGKIASLITFLSLSMLIQTLISFERYVKICWHIQYPRVLPKKRFYFITAMCYLYMFILNAIPFMGWDNWTPGVECRAETTVAGFTRYIAIPHIPICLLVALGFYIAIFRKVKKQKQQVGQYGNAFEDTLSQRLQIVTPTSRTARNNVSPKLPSVSGPSASPGVTLRLGGLNAVSSVVPGPSMGGESGIYGPSGAAPLGATTPRLGGPSTSHTRSGNSNRATLNLSTNNVDAKVAKMTAVILGCFFALYCPYPIIFWCEKYFEKGSLTYAVLRNIAVELLSLSSAINPFIYGLMNSQFRRAFFKMLKC